MSCVLRQLAEASGYATGMARLRYNPLEEIIRYLNTLDLDHPDIKIGRDLHEIVRKVAGHPDPYTELKRGSNRTALDWFFKKRKSFGERC